ncbi:MAG TPA: sigma-70 family RNA polymerase sigma factor [Gemmataceae bacterium]|nr:sigma-70 family RNA polymerase sigma factor [Gemmataceae bacterium]
MPTSPMNKVIQHLRVIARNNGESLSDAQLLAHFLTRRDEVAFETLVRRHGAMVLGVCHRVLRNADDAEDAFQATFLVLVRKAASITKRATVGGWLYGVAYKTALKARAAGERRRRKERQASAMARRETPQEDFGGELHELLDEELNRLPDKYRVPIVLCDLEGKTRKEAANQLGWPEGTLSGRLSRARALLAKRLTRHGLTLSGGIAALGLSGNATPACLPSPLVASTVKAASCLAAGQAAIAGAIPVKVAALMDGVLKSMLLAKLKIAGAVVLMVGMLGGGLLAPLALSEPPAEATPNPKAEKAEQPRPQAKKEQVRTDRYGDPLPPGALARFGTIRLRPGGSVFHLACLPDGKTFLSVASEEEAILVSVWRMATGELLRRHKTPKRSLQVVALSPDGKMLAAVGTVGGGENGVHFWDVATGKRKAELAEVGAVQQVAFSPDGRTLVMGDGDFLPDGTTNRTFHLFDAITGEDRPFMAAQHARVFSVAFAPDGRMLAWADASGIVTLWDVAAGQVRRRLKGHYSYVDSLVFSPDGKTLASGSADTTVLVWDTTGQPIAARPGALSPKQVQSLWDDLAGKDASKAFDAIGLLSTSPEQAVSLLKEKLRSAPAPADRRQVAPLIADLDSDRFEVRQKAMKQLRRLGERAEPVLRETLKGKLTLEARKRIKELLEDVRALTVSPEGLRRLRAMEVLEHIGTPEARQVLESLAKGAPTARLTQEAKVALDRLAKRRNGP